MGGRLSIQHVAAARVLRRHLATYEENRDLVLMGAYRAGADALLDRAIAMQDAMRGFLSQAQRETVPLEPSIAALRTRMSSLPHFAVTTSKTRSSWPSFATSSGSKIGASSACAKQSSCARSARAARL